MKFEKIVQHRIPFWFGPLRVGAWTFRLVMDEVNPDPDDLNQITEPSIDELPTSANGVLRLSEPVQSSEKRTEKSEFIRYDLNYFDRQFTVIEGTMDDYFTGFSSKTRSTLRRKVRKFAKSSGGNIDIRPYKTVDSMDEFFRLASTVSKQTYQEKLYNAGIRTDEEYLKTMKDLASKDMVRAWVLFLDEVPISYLYCPANGDRLHYEFLGFVPEYASLSPGTVLQVLAFEQLFEEKKFRLFDFSRGEGEHKRFFGNRSIACADVLYLRPCIGARLFVALHRTVKGFSDAADSIAEIRNFRATLRKMLRGHGS